jgi:hypothetical protein
MVEQSALNQSTDGGSNPPLRSTSRPHQKDGFRGRIEIRPIEQAVLVNLVQRFHYSKVMPRLTKLCLGGFVEDKLVIGASFGFGRKPEDTIHCLFPSMGIKGQHLPGQLGYYEIGKMCGDDAAPANTESAFIGGFLRWFKKNRPDIKVIFTWADGVWGKPGYVYQASNFLYGGEIWTDRYIVNGCIINPSQLRSQLAPVRGESLATATPHQRHMFEAWTPPSLRLQDGKDWKNLQEKKQGRPFKDAAEWQEWLFSAKWLRSRPSAAQMKLWGWRHILGQQFRYVYFLQDGERLLAESAVAWTRKYPKKETLQWKEGKTVLTKRPEFKSLPGKEEEEE